MFKITKLPILIFRIFKIATITAILVLLNVFSLENLLISQSYTSESFINNISNEIVINTKLDKKTNTTIVNRKDYKKLISETFEYSQFNIKSQNIETELSLNPSNFYESDFKVYVNDNQNQKEINVNLGKHFNGISNSDKNSIVGVSCFHDEIHGLISTSHHQQFEISSILSNQDLLLNVKPVLNYNNISCSTDDWDHYIESNAELNTRTKETCKRTAISIRVDYQLYLKLKSDTQAVVKYVLTLFNQVYTLYKKENIQISLSEIIINSKPDGLPHSSANTNLNFIKNNYKTFKGNILLCLSGFTRNGKATLGGVAYINALCLKTFAYAFGNVDGVLSNEGTFSNDVYLATHELGHVFGSRHTHACVWGPNKNQAIDNCGTPEGTCARGPKPTKGTIMSYCHLTGNPGIDFTMGFGKEPGDLMRTNVNNSSCLSNYSPILSDLSKADQHIKANVECGNGTFTNYYFDNNTVDENDDIFIASINKNGQDIGSVIDGSLTLIAHSTILFGQGKSNDIKVNYSKNNVILANRYWEINSTKIITKPINLKINFNSSDLKDIQSSQFNVSTDKLSFYIINKPSTANPDLKHLNVTSQQYLEYKSGPIASSSQWAYTKLNESIQQAEFQISNLNLEAGISFNKANEIRGRNSTTEKIHILNNPVTQSEIIIHYESNSPEELQSSIMIHDLQGALLHSYSQYTTLGMNQINIPIETLNNGIFILTLKNEKIKRSFQIIISKSE